MRPLQRDPSAALLVLHRVSRYELLCNYDTHADRFPDPAYVCVSCNEKIENDHLSLFSNWRRTSSIVNEHQWFHHMILYQAVSESACAPSVEDRLQSLESDFRNLESSFRERQDEVTERLERLEGMLKQLLGAVQENSKMK